MHINSTSLLLNGFGHRLFAGCSRQNFTYQATKVQFISELFIVLYKNISYTCPNSWFISHFMALYINTLFTFAQMHVPLLPVSCPVCVLRVLFFFLNVK